MFFELCDKMKDVHARKAYDYGSNNDPLGNFSQARRFGVSPFVGIMIRLNDKVTRVENFINKGNLMNESVHDALLDIANYALLGLVELVYDDSKVPSPNLPGGAR
jgi:hypothetical protein